MLDLCGQDRFGAIDEGERRFTSWLGGVGADGPKNLWQFVDPALAMPLEAVEASCLAALEDLCICSLGLAIALGMCDRGEAKFGTQAFTVGPEETAGELRAVVCDDAVWHSKTADDAPDELDSCSGWDGAYCFLFCPFGELVNSDKEEAVAPLRLWEGSQYVQPPDRERP